ncbi:hypothetical protein CYY_000366 [Polysphondylium violaceum]|uniref:Oxidoreductase n=1 Tax=Polysphondylium violaceum TaxID=133409 RepID=A0A8J4Q1T2_9MYCE|nr:hypothetical protein CYY_000366 [Polysphondylium violaceum]
MDMITETENKEKKLVVITGASSGYGKELAQLFSSQGYPLLLLARRVELMKEMNLPNTLCKQVDVTDYASVEAAVKEAEQHFNLPVDLMVNNAGYMALTKSYDTDCFEQWEKMVDVNIKGVLNGTKAVINSMKARNTGTIINISSIAGFKTFTDHSVYCSTKFAVHAFTETAREELAPFNVRMLLVSPGVSETELLSHTTNTTLKNNYLEWKKTMQGQSLKPIEICKSILFIYQMPQSVSIRDLVIAPTRQSG